MLTHKVALLQGYLTYEKTHPPRTLLLGPCLGSYGSPRGVGSHYVGSREVSQMLTRKVEPHVRLLKPDSSLGSQVKNFETL